MLVATRGPVPLAAGSGDPVPRGVDHGDLPGRPFVAPGEEVAQLHVAVAEPRRVKPSHVIVDRFDEGIAVHRPDQG